MKFIVSESYETFVHRINASGKILSAELLFVVESDEDATEADALHAVREYLLANNLMSIENAKLQTLVIDEMVNFRNFKVSAEYETSSADAASSGDNSEKEEPSLSFNCGGGTKHVTFALAQTCYRASGANPINIGTAVNWNGLIGESSEFAGVDVPSADMQETYTLIMKRSALTNSFKRNVASLTGCVNSTNFKGWSPGEVMFLGCSFSGVDKASENITVNFNFSIKMNERNASLEGISLGRVEGWDYVWAVKPKMTWVDGRMSNKVEYVFVSRVVPRKNFSVLGL